MILRHWAFVVSGRVGPRAIHVRSADRFECARGAIIVVRASAVVVVDEAAMKSTVSIEIAQPRERVVQLLADLAHIPKWLRGLVLHEPLSGMHGQVGTESRVVMQTGQQKMELIETITRREPANLHGIPSDSVVHYDREIVAKGMWSAARERFTEAGPETTLWESENEYRFSSLPMRLMVPFIRGAFRKQSHVHMQDFKAFAEHGTDIREAKG